MAIYRNGKKVTGIYRQGRAFTGVYRGGRKLFGVGEPEAIQGLVLEAVEAETGTKKGANELDFHYALNTISGNQREYYVDLLLGTKVLRLAGDMTGRIKGEYKDGVLTWSGVKVTDENLYIGKLIDVKIKHGASEVLYATATYPKTDKAVYEFKNVNVNSESQFVAHVREYYNTPSDAMFQYITVDGHNAAVANINGKYPTFENYTYVAKQGYGAGTFNSATMQRDIFSSKYKLFYEPRDIKDEVEYKNLYQYRQNEVKIVTPAADKIIQFKIKGIIK